MWGCRGVPRRNWHYSAIALISAVKLSWGVFAFVVASENVAQRLLSPKLRNVGFALLGLRVKVGLGALY